MSSRPTKVCLIQDYLAPYRIPLFARIAANEGIDFTLLLMANEHPSYKQWATLWHDPPFKCVLVPGIRYRLKSEMESRFNPNLFFVLARLRPDLVICSGFSSNTVLALIYRLLFHKRIIIWTEATAATESHLSYPNLRTRLRRLIASKIDAIIDAGTEARNYAKSLLPSAHRLPFFRSYNAIDTIGFAQRCDHFRAEKDKFQSFRNKFPVRNILFSGRLIELKNIRRLLEVYEEILRCNPTPVGLIILGQGPLHSLLEERKRVHHLEHLYIEGFQLEDEYYKYFALADVFILLSVYDCNPLVVIEALAAGLPTICSKYAGNAIDFISDGRNGFIVDPNDIPSVVQKTLTIMNTSDKASLAATAKDATQKANYDMAAQAFIEAIEVVCVKIPQ